MQSSSKNRRVNETRKMRSRTPVINGAVAWVVGLGGETVAVGSIEMLKQCC